MLSELLLDIAPVHYEHFKHDSGFPGVSYISSQVIASYLKRELKGDVRIVYGTFGPNRLFHCWVEYDGIIVDLTQFQFIAYKERQSFYKRLNGQELLAYALSHQESLFIKPHDKTRLDYQGLAVMKEEFGHILAGGMTYDSFVGEVFRSKEYEEASWLKSKDENSKTFADIIKVNGLYITRRFFSKWAIYPIK